MSAIHNMGKMMPVDSFAPNAMAILGTVRAVMPCIPVFDIPISTADKQIVIHCVTVSVSIIFNTCLTRVFVYKRTFNSLSIFITSGVTLHV